MRTRKPSRTAQLSLEEIDDERIYRAGQCFLCLDIVPKEWKHGRRVYSIWQVSAGQYLLLHASCAPRAAAEIGRRPVREILPILRAMRPEAKS